MNVLKPERYRQLHFSLTTSTL